MSNDSSLSQETQSPSVQARDHLLRFLRLIAKDVVRRLAVANAGDAPRDAETKSGRQNP
jgi:hypothetical protein